MTKPNTATLVMTLFEEGKLRLTDPISDYLPEFKNMTVLEVDEGNHTVKPSYSANNIQPAHSHGWI